MRNSKQKIFFYYPYQDNSLLEEKLNGKKELNKETEIKAPKKENIKVEIEVSSIEKTEKEKSIREAFEFGLSIKKNVLGKTSYSGFQGRINRFLNWLDENASTKDSISILTKKTIINYLNYVLENTLLVLT